jgi:hypothetical protein
MPPPCLSNNYSAIVLHLSGVENLSNGRTELLERYVKGGGRLVILSGQAIPHTINWANTFLKQYGIVVHNEERTQCHSTQHQIHKSLRRFGVTRVYWQRVNPITTLNNSDIVVFLDGLSKDGVVARCGPGRRIWVIGTSLLADIVCHGWPYHNGGLLAAPIRIP